MMIVKKTLIVKIILVLFFSVSVYFLAMNFLQEKVESFLYASVEKYYPKTYTKNPSIPLNDLGLFINSKSSLSFKIDKEGNIKTLYSKFPKKILPIASITKLMTAIITLENYSLSEKTVISNTAINQYGNAGNLLENQTISVESLFRKMIIESSNDSAFALSEIMGTNNFLEKMNKKAKELGMENTYYINPTGLDPKNLNETINHSTTRDLARIVKYIIKNHPTILETSKTHSELNTNKLLYEIPNIVGGKTGYTEIAGGSILLVLKDDRENIYINIILGTIDRESRFLEMSKLISAILNFK